MTMKSKMGSGKYPDYTIEKMLTYDKMREYLAYNYFNYDKIGFTDEVLSKLFGSKLEYFKIPKPGKNPELYEEYYKMRFKLNDEINAVEPISIDDFDIDTENVDKDIEDISKDVEDQNKKTGLKAEFNDSVKMQKTDLFNYVKSKKSNYKYIENRYNRMIDLYIKNFRLDYDEILNMYDKKSQKFDVTTPNHFEEKMMLNCVITAWLKRVKKINTDACLVKAVNVYTSNMDNDKSKWAVIGFTNKFNNHKQAKPLVTKDIAYVTFDIKNDKKPLKLQGIISKEDFNKSGFFSKFNNHILIPKDIIKK